MNKKMIFSVLLSGAVAGSSLPLAVTANASDVVYGTMEIPYSEFYSSEGINGVDTVSSATTNKWKNENLVAGTYSVETEDGGGDILGVKYYVAVSENDLAQLDESYHFEKVDEVPQAYKNVTVENGKAVFSEVVGNTTKEENTVTMNTNMPWGDYVLDVSGLNNSGGTSEFGTIYGIVIKTDDGSKYGMRHLENIWRDEIAWSSGIKKSEPHGNVFKYEHYESLMGKTIKEVTYITDTGYHTINVDLYVPVKFEGSVEIENADINTGSTSFTTTGFPEDYEKTYFVAGNGQFSVEDGVINYQVEFPGSYTLTVSDGKGKYADVSTSFVISTDDMPVQFDGEKLVPADSASQEDFDAFIRNISAVTVDEKTYSASGRGGVKIISNDGTVIEDASARGTAVFEEYKTYDMTVNAVGYNNPVSFSFTKSLIYGIMNVPYGEFYKGEGIDGVDTVSSATTNKWKNENLVKGTYSVETENGGGDILGVRYYVALSKATFDALGENNYNFEPVEEIPTAYKLITIENDEVVFSNVVGDTTEEQKEVSLSTEMAWGDYVLDVSGLNNSGGTSDFGTIYGVILETAEGDKYGMRHLENIWRDEIAWSSGIKKSEPHGNIFKYEQYVGLMGQTLTGITFITETGYHTVPVNIYIPVKFENTVEIADCSIKDIATTFTTTGFPEDYEKTYFVSGNGQFSVEDGTINYKVQFPGSYSLEISDAKGKYAAVNTSFVISTDDMPAKFDGEKLIPADNASQEDFDAFIRNISAVTVDENTYSAKGKRGLKLINDDGTIIIDAVFRDVPVFAEDKPYHIAVTATGYNNTLEFVLNDDTKQEESSEPSEISEVSEMSEVSENSEKSEVSQVSEISQISQNSEVSQISEISPNSQTSTNDNNNNSNANSNSNAVNTGSADFALTAVLMAVISALATIFSFKKKKYN